jgi:hypothetical protein
MYYEVSKIWNIWFSSLRFWNFAPFLYNNFKVKEYLFSHKNHTVTYRYLHNNSKLLFFSETNCSNHSRETGVTFVADMFSDHERLNSLLQV